MAIIGVLAALLLPALAKAKLKAREVACSGNLRQIGIALHGFAHDHGGLFPQQLSTNAGGALEPSRFPEPWWGQFIRSPAPFAAISNELGNPRVLGCPAAARGPSNFANLKASEVGYLALVSARLGDAQGVLAVDGNLDQVRTRRVTNGPAAGQLEVVWTPERHDGRGNALWGDGHVELRRSLQLSLPGSAGGGPGTGPTGGPNPDGGGSGGQGNGGSGGRGNGSPSGGRAGEPGAAGPAAAPLPAPSSSGRTIGQTALPAAVPLARTPVPGTDRLAPATPSSGAVIGGGSAWEDEREERERRDRWIQRGLLLLMLACMLLGLTAVLSHAWQRYRALS